MAVKFLPGNRLTLLNSGAEYFPALLGAIHDARREVHLESYIFENDDTGRAIADALASAARRGVAVRVLVDGFGASGFADQFQPQLAAAGVQALVYRPEIARFRLRRHRLRRLHRKLVAIDGEIAFVGGINVIDDRTPQFPTRHDYAVRIEGPLLGPIQFALRRVWELVVWARLNRRFRLPRTLHEQPKARGQQTAAFLVRDNIRHRRDIEEAYLAAIATARENILLANAYFLPGRRFRRALYRAARRGVRVVILLQGRVEYRLLHYATQALYGRMLRAGIHIFEYRRGFLHAKVAVVDDHWATVGSSNIDPFSLLLAREANVVVRDADFARHLRTRLVAAIEGGGRPVLAPHHARRSLPVRLMNWCAYGLLRAGVALSGRATRY